MPGFELDGDGLIRLESDYNERALLRIILEHPSSVFGLWKNLKPAMFRNAALGSIYERTHLICTATNGIPQRLPPEVVLSTFTGHSFYADVEKALREIGLDTFQVPEDTLGLHAGMVRKLAVRRGYLNMAERLALLARADNIDEKQLGTKAARWLGELEMGEDVKPIYSPQVRMEMGLADLTARQDGTVTDISTGYSHLDKVLGGGLAKGTVTTITGITGGFKSTFTMACARRMAAQGKKVLYISAEMPEVLLTMKDLSAYTGITIDTFRTVGGLTDENWVQVMQAMNFYSKRTYYTWPFNGSVEEMRSIVQFMQDTIGVDVVIFDYLQIIQDGHASKSVYESVSKISGAIRDLSRDLNIAVMLLAQMNRGVYGPTMVPSLNLLKDSGSIENDSAAVVGIYWPFGVSRLPGKFVPSEHTPWSMDQWLETGAVYVPFDTTEIPVVTEIQLLVLKNRFGLNMSMVRLGLNAANHDVFDPYVAQDWMQTAPVEEWEALPSLDGESGSVLYGQSAQDMQPYFSQLGSPSTLDLRASLQLYRTMDTLEVTAPLNGDVPDREQSFLGAVVKQLEQSAAIITAEELV